MASKSFFVRWLFLGLIIFTMACSGIGFAPFIQTAIAPAPVQYLVPRIVARLPHDVSAFTEGLFWQAGTLYESSGQYAKSNLRQVDPQTGKVLRRLEIPADDFGEGIALVGDRLIELTWKEHTAFIFALPSLKQIGSYSYAGEGWGLCTDASGRLLMSDGSATITVRDPDTFEIVRQFQVTLDGTPITQLNELEMVDGWLYANVWQTDYILRIDPFTGRVTAQIDAAGLLTPAEKTTAGADGVLNGIAYDSSAHNFLITGKLWPWLFVVQFVPRP